MKDRLIELQMNAEKPMTLSSLTERLNSSAAISERSRLLSSDTTSDINDFLSLIDVLAAEVNDLDIMLEDITETHSKLLVDPGEQPELNTELERRVAIFTKSISRLRNTLTDLNSEVEKQYGDSTDTSAQCTEARIKRNQVMALTKKFQMTLIRFNDEQLRYKDKCKQKFVSYLRVSGIQMSDEDIEDAVENGTLFEYTKSIMLAEKDVQALYDEVKLRHEDILKLERAINDLQGLFLDLSALIHSQGEMLDNIERNVQSAVEYSHKAEGNMKKAGLNKRCAIKMKICIVIGLIITVLLLFAIGSTLFCFYLPFLCRH